jgi:uncharacterized RDD family membrane protein YckC
MATPGPQYRTQGAAALHEGRVDEAVDLLRWAVDADPRDADAQGLLGTAYSRKGLHPEAVAAPQAAVSLVPSHAGYRLHLAEALERAGDHHQAVAAYQALLQLQPGHPQATARLHALGTPIASPIAGPAQARVIPPMTAHAAPWQPPMPYGQPPAAPLPAATGYPASPGVYRPGFGMAGAYGPGMPPGEPNLTVGDAFFKRLVATFLDGLLLLIPLVILLGIGVTVALAAGAGKRGDEGEGLFVLCMIVVYLSPLPMRALYGGYTLSRSGQTLGMRAMGLRVVRPSGEPLSFWRAAGRESIGKLISGAFSALGYLWMLWDPRQQTWHDKIFDTLVVGA